jgi:hypothetical protein
MNLDWIYLAILLIGIEIGHRKGILYSVAILLLFFPLRMMSYRLAFLLSDFVLNRFKGILDYQLQWTESVIRTVEAGDLTHFSEGSRLLLDHPMMQNDRTASWISEMTQGMIVTPDGIDRLSNMNLIQGIAFVSLLVLLAVAMVFVGKMTRKLEFGKHDQIGGAVVFSILGLFLVYQALLVVAPSVWLVPASSISQGMADSWMVKKLFTHNPLMYL